MSVVDLHCHSTASDGILSPTEVVARAKENGVKMLALTDHDSVNGLEEAQVAAKAQGITLINAAEISCLWSGHTIHVTALNIDPSNAELQTLLQKIQDFRVWRGKEIGRKLEKHGIENAYAETMKLVKGDLLTRSHYGHFLFNNGHSKTLQKSFDKYLLQGKPGHVKGKWESIEDVVAAIHAAGGLACIAHPKRYKMTNTKLNRLFAVFKEAGGDGIEVINANSNPEHVAYLAKCADKFKFLSSIGSDFHFPNKWVELGRLKALPQSCQPIWQHF